MIGIGIGNSNCCAKTTASDALRAVRGPDLDLLEIPNLNNHRNLSKVRKIRSLDVPVAGSSQ
jgi:hypothetical protein